MRILFAPALLLLLGGCAALAIPPALSIASYAGDGVSYLATNKTISDHMLSDALGRDCATWRILRGKSICKDFTPEQAAARAKARRETRYDVERAQVAQIDGPFSASGAIEGTAIAQAPKKEAKPSAGVGRSKVTRETLSAVASATGGAGRKSAAAPTRRKARTASGAVARTAKAKTAPKAVKAKTAPHAVRLVAVRRTAKSPRKVPSALPGRRRFVVFGSFRNKRAAARLARRHRILDPFVVPARVRGTTYYRVVTRPQDRTSIAMAFRSLRRAGVRDAYTIRACRTGRVNARCLRQVPHLDRVTKKAFENLLKPKPSRRGRTVTLVGG